MKINWKVRFKNKTWLLSFITLIVSFAYDVITMLGITPDFLETDVMKAVNTLLMLLGMMGVIEDPTTAGIGDSKRALTYDEPWIDEPVKDDG